MYGIPVITRSLSLEINLRAVTAGSQIPFPDNNILRQAGVKIIGIDAFVSSQLTNTSSGGTVITDADAQKITVNCLDDRNIIIANQLPYFNLISSYNNGVIREFKPFTLVVQKSFIQINAAISSGQWAVLNILYEVNG
jgi:hypothetical protein